MWRRRRNKKEDEKEKEEKEKEKEEEEELRQLQEKGIRKTSYCTRAQLASQKIHDRDQRSMPPVRAIKIKIVHFLKHLNLTDTCVYSSLETACLTRSVLIRRRRITRIAMVSSLPLLELAYPGEGSVTLD